MTLYLKKLNFGQSKFLFHKLIYLSISLHPIMTVCHLNTSANLQFGPIRGLSASLWHQSRSINLVSRTGEPHNIFRSRRATEDRVWLMLPQLQLQQQHLSACMSAPPELLLFHSNPFRRQPDLQGIQLLCRPLIALKPPMTEGGNKRTDADDSPEITGN